jgi:hypothetical protein
MKYLAFSLLLLSTAAHAECECACVNGNMQAICSSGIDLPPICPLTICPLVPPSIAPIATPMIPPIGTQFCHPEQVYVNHHYEWRTICR